MIILISRLMILHSHPFRSLPRRLVTETPVYPELGGLYSGKGYKIALDLSLHLQ